jgi:hypothetical protein
MNNYFSLTIEEQRQVLQAAEGRIGLPAQAIEKDLWVTTILQIVFTLPFANKLIFKGGTSLSKYIRMEKDYAEMLVNMIHGSNKPTFNQIIERMQILQDRFR